MKINATLNHADDLLSLKEAGADCVSIGARGLALRMEASFSFDQMKDLIKTGKELGIEVLVVLNKIMHNRDLPLLNDWLLFLEDNQPTAVVFNDISVYQRSKSLGLSLNLYFDSDMMINNSVMGNTWFDLGIKRLSISKELTLDEYTYFAKQAKGEVEVLAQGLVSMFHSIRPLVTHYEKYLNHEEMIDLSKTHQLNLYDSERDLFYPIVEDDMGTHIMNGKEVCLIDELHDLLDATVDVIKIDGYLQTREYVLRMVALYREGLDLLDTKEYHKQKMRLFIEAQNLASRPLDKGFLFKPTMYKVRD